MNEAGRRLFVFHSCDRKAGTTMMAHCIAKSIAQLIEDSRVLFVALNGNDDVHYCKGKVHSIEGLKMQVDNNLLKAEELKALCVSDGPLYVLGGVQGVFTHRNYSPEFPELLIEKAFEIFDVVIADCGNELDSGLCVGTLKAGGIPVMVIRQNESTLARFEHSQRVYRALGIKFSNYIINRYSDNDPHDISYIRSRLDAKSDDIFFTVKEEAGFSRLAEIDGQLILDYRCPGFSEDIKEISGQLLKYAGFSERAKPTARRKLFNFI